MAENEEEKGAGLPQAILEEPPETLSKLTQALEKKETEINALVDRLKRTAAEFENYKKRVAKDKEEFRKFALEGLILELLPVIDNLERAIQHGEEFALKAQSEGESPAFGLLEGVKITLGQLVKCLEKFGVTSFDSKGEAFDPVRHEAMEAVESSLFSPNTVVEEHRKGYLLNGRVLRPALVTVCKGSSEEPIANDKLQMTNDKQGGDLNG